MQSDIELAQHLCIDWLKLWSSETILVSCPAQPVQIWNLPDLRFPEKKTNGMEWASTRFHESDEGGLIQKNGHPIPREIELSRSKSFARNVRLFLPCLVYSCWCNPQNIYSYLYSRSLPPTARFPAERSVLCIFFVSCVSHLRPIVLNVLHYQVHLLQCCHPVNACGHEGSFHLSPVLALWTSIAMQVHHSYKSSTILILLTFFGVALYAIGPLFLQPV